MKNTSIPSPEVTAIPIDKDYVDEMFKWVDKMAVLMDSKFRIPGTQIRFGLDPVLGFVPVLGNLATYSISALLIWVMHRHGASRKVAIMMVGNVLLDAVIGSVPLVGNVFDIFYKANNRNVQLLKNHYQFGKHQGTGNNLLAAGLMALFVILVLIITFIWRLIIVIF